LQRGEAVLEIGPGLGSLTLGLLGDGHPVTAIEIDPVLAEELSRTIAARMPEAALAVINGDALRIEIPGEPTALVANLPYNVAVPVLLRLLESVPSVRRGLVLVQAEVAERLAATPGTKAYGVPSVKLAWYAAARRAGSVSRTVFWPEPNVDSGLVRIVRRDPPPTTASRQSVFEVIDAAFAQRRKTLRAALAGWAGSAADAERLLVAAGIDPRARGETLDVQAFARLAEQRN
jgi:16S rRNA (adenine1518-N6/adenine1519-N6)-dimethyltransferase